MAVKLIFISADGSEQKKLTPKVSRILDRDIYEFEEFPNFSIHTRGNCDVEIKHRPNFIGTLQGAFNIVNSTVSIESLYTLQDATIANSKFISSNANLINAHVTNSDLNIHNGNIYNSNIIKSVLDCGEVTINESSIQESKLEKVDLDVEHGIVGNTNIKVISEDLFVPNLTLTMFGHVNDINLDWKGGKHNFQKYVACMGTHPHFICRGDLFGIYRQDTTSSTAGDNKEKSVLEYIYLNGILTPLCENMGTLNLGVK